MTSFHYTRDTERGIESLIVAGEVVRTVPSSHPHFIAIRDYCFTQDRNGAEIDMEHVLALYDTEQRIIDEFLRITDRVSFRGGKLLWDGEPTEGALVDHIVHMVQEHDDNYTAFALFLENLAQNPSEASRASLFEWIADRRFTITEDGCFVGYKGVTEEYLSLTSGYGVVNGVEMDGQLPNHVGNVVEVPRSRVDPDRNSACSYGLHVGTRSYATSYGTRMVIVAVNPRDVVMVPRDGGGHKMRVCKYTVLADNDEELTTTTYDGQHRADEDVEDDGWSGWEAPLDNECEDCGCELNEDGECACCEEEGVPAWRRKRTEEVCEYCGGPLDENGYCPDE